MDLEEIDFRTENASAKFIPKLSMQEYFIDFLGGLVPGILFLIGNCFIIFPSIHALNSSLCLDGLNSSFLISLKNLFEATKGTPSAFWVVLFIVIFFLAYTIGHIFYRHDPSLPDRKGIRRLEKKIRKSLDDKNIKSEKKIISELACNSNLKNCQFPYSYYNLYLEKRGLKYLSNFVIWKKDRSKSYINLLKTRLMYHRPDKCGTIIRNEAHVRLASSTWYVARFLQWFGLGGFLLSLGSLFLSVNYSKHFSSYSLSLSWYIVPLILPLLVAAFSNYFYVSIPNFLHYQRLREVFYVLDTYCIAFQENPDLMKVPVDNFMKEIVDTYKLSKGGMTSNSRRQRIRSRRRL